MSKMTKQEYQKFVDKKTPPSPILKDVFFAFLIGGIICTIGQVLLNCFIKSGVTKEIAGSYTSITLVFLTAILTALNIFDNIAKVAGAGTLVPITGFANSIVSPAMEFRSEGFISGVGVKMFTIAGPVLVYGSVASVIAGLIYYFIQGAKV